MVSVSIIGVGRVGGAVALSLPRDEYTVERLIVRGNSGIDPIAQSLSPSPVVTTLNDVSDITSEVIFITTQDAHIVTVARELAGKIKNAPIVFHTSGSYSSSILANL